MSYPVRVVIKETVTEQVRAADQVRLQLCADPVVARPDARVKVVEQAEAKGWERQVSGEGDERREVLIKRFDDGVVATWDLDGNQVTIAAESDDSLEREETIRVQGDAVLIDERERVRADLEQRARERVKEREAERTEAGAQREKEMLAEVQEKIEARVGEVAEDVASVQEDFYKAWVKTQAERLGTITSQTEHESADGSTYELTIKIDA